MVHRQVDESATIAQATDHSALDIGAGADQKMTADLLATVQDQSDKGGAPVESVSQEQEIIAYLRQSPPDRMLQKFESR